MIKTADNHETVARYQMAIIRLRDALADLGERVAYESFRVEFSDEEAGVTEGDALSMETAAQIVSALCPERAVRLDGEWVHRDERDPAVLKRAARYGKERCDAFFGPGVCDEFFV